MSDRNTTPEQSIDPELLQALLVATAPIAPPDTLRVKVLERIQTAKPAADFKTLRDGYGWTELLPGLSVKRLFVDEQAGTKSFLLRALPGTSLPAHGHQGAEECIVLEGEFSMGELTLRAGDYHLAAAGSTHPVTHTRTGVTVYLRAPIADYPGI